MIYKKKSAFAEGTNDEMRKGVNVEELKNNAMYN
jgi:hypothetical protein